MQHLTLSIVLSFTLLASIGGINKAVLMSYNLLTDSDKAARLCTCTSCTSHSDEISIELTSCCSSSVDSNTDKNSENGVDTVMSCGIPTNDGTMVCGCDDNKLPEEHIKLLMLDKVTLPAFVTLVPPVPKLRSVVLLHETHASLFQPGIFHPPRI
jgi:hypothetical protein